MSKAAQDVIPDMLLAHLRQCETDGLEGAKACILLSLGAPVA